MIQFLCSACGTELRIADEHAGKAVKCKKCDSLIRVPSIEEAKSQAATAATAQKYRGLMIAGSVIYAFALISFVLAGVCVIGAAVGSDSNVSSADMLGGAVSCAISGALLLGVSAASYALHGIALNVEKIANR